MQIRRRLYFVALLLFVQAAAFSQEEQPVPFKVLFIGNSYTSVNDLPAMVEGLADAAGGRKIDADRHLVGGCTLERHVKEKKAIDKIQAEKWDVVVLQEQSLRPVLDRQSMHEYARILDAEIKQQGTKTVFYLTWARQHIPDMQEGADPATTPGYARAIYQIGKAAKTTAYEAWCQQQKAGLEGGLNGAYFDIAEELRAKVAPVGIAWKKALAADPFLVLHRPDKSHPNPRGTYLAACVFYATLLDKSPVGLPGKIERDGKVLIDLPDEEAKRLQETAWDAIEEIDAKELNKVATYANSEGIAVKSTSPHNKLVFIIAAVAATGGLLFGLQDCAFSTSGLVKTAPACEMITEATRHAPVVGGFALSLIVCALT